MKNYLINLIVIGYFQTTLSEALIAATIQNIKFKIPTIHINKNPINIIINIKDIII